MGKHKTKGLLVSMKNRIPKKLIVFGPLFCGSRYNHPEVSIDGWDCFLKEELEMEHVPKIYRGILANCANAKEIAPVWAGFGWVDCDVKWLRYNGCPEYLISARSNDRVKESNTYYKRLKVSKRRA